MKMSFKALCGVGMLSVAGSAMAIPYTEVGDAGQSLAGAQVLGAGVDVVYGSLGSDADLYQFNWGGGAFYVNSVGTPFDSQLFLFNSAGQGVMANDDGIAYAGPAYLQSAGLAAGSYYLGISAFNSDPYSASGLMFQSYPYEPVYGPLNSDPLAYWGGSPLVNSDYIITFGQTTSSGQQGPTNPVGVPEPATLGLMGLGLAAIGGLRRRRNIVG